MLVAVPFFAVTVLAAAQQPELRPQLEAAFQKGMALRKQGKDDESIAFFRKAAELAPQVFGPDHVNTAGILSTLGTACMNAGRYAEAEDPFRRGLAIREAALGKDHLDVARSLNNLAMVLGKLTRFRESEALYQRCLAIREPRLGKDHELVIVTVGNLGGLYTSAGRFVEAERLILRCLRAQEAKVGKQHRDLTTTLVNLSALYRQMGRLEEAEAAARRGLAISDSAWGKDDLHAPYALNNLALALNSLGRPAEAESLLRRGLAIREAKLGKTHPDVATSLFNLGMQLAHQGRLAEAEPMLRRSLTLCETALGKDHTSVASMLSGLAGLCGALRRDAEAEALEKRGLAIREQRLGKDHPDVVSSLNNLAFRYMTTGRHEEALPLLLRCMQIGERRYGKNHVELATVASNLGLTYLHLGRFGPAQQWLQRALALHETRADGKYPAVALDLHNLASLNARMGQFAQADDYLRRALPIAIAGHGEDHPNVARCLLLLARVNQALGRSAQAMAFQERGLAIYDRQLRQVLGFNSEATVFDYLRHMSGVIPTTISLAAADPSAASRTAAFTWTLRLKGITLDSLCRYREAQRRVGADDPLARPVSRYRTVKQLLASAALAPPEGLSAEQAARQIAQWRREAGELEAAINRGLADRLHGPDSDSAAITTAAVHQQLAPGTALVEFVAMARRDFQAERWLTPHYYAFVLAPGTAAPQLIDLGDAREIEAGVEAVRQDFAELQDKLRDAESPDEAHAIEKQQEAQFQKRSAAIAKQIFAPLEAALGAADLVYLVPDASLNRLPFEALVGRDGKYLIERYRFAYLSSGRDLLRAQVKAAQGTVVFAAPDYQLDATGRNAAAAKLQAKPPGAGTAPTVRSIGWKALPGAADEAKDIESILQKSALGPVKTYVGADALEEVLKALPAPRVLHLATHGYFLDHKPAEAPDDDGEGAGWARGRLRRMDDPLLRSGIILAGANLVGDKTAGAKAAPADDGWVTAEEIALLDLRGTQLVVLSACQSGLGDVKTGEGVYGLRRAFLYAGVRSMVTSLFEVPDQETRQLMQRFYRELHAGQGQLAALHTAQLALLRQRRMQHGASHPFFWASFVLVGDPH
jgi:CHAT domain-containing protein/Tfp pilus assembly protein PilF